MNKTIEELRDYLLENYVDEFGDLNLSGLDFSEFDGDVILSGMVVKRNLYQSHHKVKGDLFQRRHKVKYDLVQDLHDVRGDLSQGYQTVKGDYFCDGITVRGDIYIEEPKKLLKKITREELVEMGYEVVDDE